MLKSCTGINFYNSKAGLCITHRRCRKQDAEFGGSEKRTEIEIHVVVFAHKKRSYKKPVNFRKILRNNY